MSLLSKQIFSYHSRMLGETRFLIFGDQIQEVDTKLYCSIFFQAYRIVLDSDFQPYPIAPDGIHAFGCLTQDGIQIILSQYWRHNNNNKFIKWFLKYETMSQFYDYYLQNIQKVAFDRIVRYIKHSDIEITDHLMNYVSKVVLSLGNNIPSAEQFLDFWYRYHMHEHFKRWSESLSELYKPSS